MRTLQALIVGGAVVCAACGGGSPAAPTALDATAAATVVTVVSGETGQPVAGASVVAAGQTLTTDASGRVSVSGATLTIDAGGYLRRETALRAADTLSLWPVPPGAGESFVAELVYHQMFSDGSLVRPTSGVTLTLSGELASDPATRAAIARAADTVTAANGTIPFSVAEGSGAGIVFALGIDPGDPVLRANPGFVAYTRVETLGHGVTGGSIVLRSRSDALRTGILAHEIGHAFGLGHTSQAGLMVPLVGSAADFSAAEKLAMRMMLKRAPGNRAPDNDTGVGAQGARETRIIACEG